MEEAPESMALQAGASPVTALLSQLMRHNEASAHMALGHTSDIIAHYQRIVGALERRVQEMEERESEALEVLRDRRAVDHERKQDEAREAKAAGREKFLQEKLDMGKPAASAMFFSLDGIKSFSTQVPAWDTHFRAFAALAQVLRIGNVGPGQTSAVTVPTGDYRVIMDFCSGASANGTACASGDTMWLGPNPDNTHNVDWKFVVAHEFGHLLQEKLSGTPAVPDHPNDPYNAPEGNASCACAHVADPTDRQHCMQSREFTGATERESFAHYVASNTWNGRSATACKFVYYKRFFETTAGTTVTKDAPYPVDCTVQAKWLENKCGTDIAGLAVEWDWMNWKRSVDTAPITENSNMGDIADIYKIACGGGTCTNKQPTPPQLVAAARSKYGATSSRALRVESDIIRYGANH